MLIGLSAKNAILIVEFAKMEYDKGATLIDAALTGARLRLRPILMTAFAFILGCVPLWRASGAGAISRQVLGTVVIGGMLAASLLAIFFIPVSFDVVERFGEYFGKKETTKTEPGSAHGRRTGVIRWRKLSALVLLLPLCACTVGPNYKRPAGGRARAVSRTRARYVDATQPANHSRKCNGPPCSRMKCFKA